MTRTMSKKQAKTTFTFFSRFDFENFKEVCAREFVYILPGMHEVKPDKGKLTCISEEYRRVLYEGESFQGVWQVEAPEWRIWGLLERLDKDGVFYETDFGLIVE